MFRYLAGLLLVQLVTVALFAVNADSEPRLLVLRAGLPALAIALLAALWFRTLSRADGERDLARIRVEHERERERVEREAQREREALRVANEREKSEIARLAERTVRREERRSGRRANLKVALAFAAMTGMGVLFVLSELVTLGLLTMTTGGGALGGYLLRWRQTRVASGTRRVGEAAAAPPDAEFRVDAAPDANGRAGVPRLPAPDAAGLPDATGATPSGKPAFAPFRTGRS